MKRILVLSALMCLTVLSMMAQDGARIMILRDYYNDVKGGIPDAIFYYDLDANGNQVKESRQDRKFDAWPTAYTNKEWTYDSQQNCTSETQKGVDGNGESYDVSRHDYTYDANNHCTLDTYSQYSSAQGWYATAKTEKTYDAEGHLTGSKYYTISSSTEMLVSTTAYTYDAAGNLTMERTEKSYSNEWIFSSKVTYEYNTANQLVNESHFTIDEESANYGMHYIYDTEGRLKQTNFWATDYKDSEGNLRDPYMSYEYYYTEDALFSDELTQGTCGAEGNEDAVKWKFDRNGTLTISGNGDMMDFDGYYRNQPWIIDNQFMRKVVIEEGVTHIGKYAFEAVDSLREVEFPSTLKSIGACAFEDDLNVGKLVLPDALQTIGNGAFDGCHALDSIQFGTGLKEMEAGAFSYCLKIRTLVFPESLQKIGQTAFRGCKSLKYVRIPAGMEKNSINDRSFADCDSLATIECYSSNLVFTYNALYNKKAVLYVPADRLTAFSNAYGYKVMVVMALGQHYVPDQYIINGKTYDYSSSVVDVYGDGSVQFYQNEIALNNAKLDEGLTLQVSDAKLWVFGTCEIKGGITAKNNLTITKSSYDEELTKLTIEGGIHCNDTTAETTFSSTIDNLEVTTMQTPANQIRRRSESSQPTSVVSGFSSFYNSDPLTYVMLEPEGGTYDTTKRMLLNADGTPATHLIFGTEAGTDGISHVAADAPVRNGKTLENGRIIITRGAHRYTTAGVEVK